MKNQSRHGTYRRTTVEIIGLEREPSQAFWNRMSGKCKAIMSRSTISNLAAGLVEAAHLVGRGYDRQARVDLPRTWDESLRDAVEAVVAAYHSGLDASRGVVAAA